MASTNARRDPVHLGIRDPNQSLAPRTGGSLDRNNKLNEIPAGMLGDTRVGLAVRDKTYLTGRTDIDQPKVAGKHVLSISGEPVNSSKLDHMREIIHAEQPPAPILDQHTTYNRNHSKEGFPNHYKEPAQKEFEYKPQEVYYTGVAGNKRHPYEVKSRFTF